MKNAYTMGTTLNNGVHLPWLGLGVYKMPKAEAAKAVRTALQNGYRAIDTASFYGNEEGVGEGIQSSGIPRDEIVLTTKIWNTDQGYDQTLHAFDESRKRLGLQYIDLYLVHWPIKATFRETWRALVHLYRLGFVRAIGVSNFQIEDLEAVIQDTGVVPVINQVEHHPLLNNQALHFYANVHNIRIVAWSPLLRGQYTGLPTLYKLAQKYQRTVPQIILRWDLQNGVVVIPKTTHKERMIENAQIFDFTLEPKDMQVIDNLNQDRHFGSVLDSDGRTLVRIP
ncbi:MAG TPA: aldo/keto reductase [Ruminococcaceae bacterium]|nr:aldo/keto reductase [Oscillospiraceae bacterium]